MPNLDRKSQPLESEVKEFWEGYGFTRNKQNIGRGSEYLWNYPDAQLGTLPSLDLNNLSRYAIPQLIKEYHNWKSVLHDWVDGLTGDYEKDTLSLYWKIAQM